MTFGTLNLLQKHKQKFCVGGSVGDPDSLRLRKGLRSDDDPIARPYSPEEKVSTFIADYPERSFLVLPFTVNQHFFMCEKIL